MSFIARERTSLRRPSSLGPQHDAGLTSAAYWPSVDGTDIRTDGWTDGRTPDRYIDAYRISAANVNNLGGLEGHSRSSAMQ